MQKITLKILPVCSEVEFVSVGVCCQVEFAFHILLFGSVQLINVLNFSPVYPAASVKVIQRVYMHTGGNHKKISNYCYDASEPSGTSCSWLHLSTCD